MQGNQFKAAQEASENFKAKFGHLECIYEITWGNRFGEPIIHVGVISQEDEAKVRPILPNDFMGITVYVVSPLWNTGDLAPELGQRMNEMMKQDYYRADPKGQHELTLLGRKLVEEEKNLWRSWSVEKRREFVRETIMERRKRDPRFANCGDKFLT